MKARCSESGSWRDGEKAGGWGGPGDLGSRPRCATGSHGTSGNSFFACLRPASGQKVNTLSYFRALGDPTGSGSQGPQEPSGAWALPLSCTSFGEPGRPLLENHTPPSTLRSTSLVGTVPAGPNLSSKLP